MDRDVDTLNLPRSIIKELQVLGYHKCNDIVSNFEGIPNKFECNWSSLIKAPKVNCALEILKEELIEGCILSYNAKLDEILHGIIRMKTITELTGNSGSGKSQICLQLCISVQLPKWCGGNEGESVYIGTNRNFASCRLRELARSFANQYDSVKQKMNEQQHHFNKEFILEHIHFISIDTCTELLASVLHLETYLKNKNVKLIVIDSISQPLRQLEGEDRLSIISELFLKLRKLAAQFNIAIVITNDLTTRVNDIKPIVTPSLGDSFYHMVNTRILLSRSNCGFRAQILKGFSGEYTTVNFSI